jgi:tRNA pseudouridine38-40 synthase
MQHVVRMTLAYDGTDFRGWAAQRDPDVRTVGGVVGDLLAAVLQEDVSLTAAGRTDAGVHARGQVVSFVTESEVTPDRILRAINAALAPEIVAREVVYAPEGFDARFSATAREYRYVIDTAAVPDPFLGRSSWHRPGKLSVPLMRAAVRQLVGELDFASFCRSPGGGRSTVRRLERVAVRREGELISIDFRANAFCHQMVRSLVGTLVAVGEGRTDPAAIPAILAARDRSAAKSLAPSQGLTLSRVVYGRRA